jgi:glycosyltransferase involved in cell wall biosynthesis
MKPLAIIPAFNEDDILGAVVLHLKTEGCDVHVIDNWSTDNTVAVARQAGAMVETWPSEAPGFYDWTGLLKRIEEIAAAHPGRWIIFHDADEIRTAPAQLAGADLALGLYIAQNHGANAVEFHVRTFTPVEEGWSAGRDPQAYFQYLVPQHIDSRIAHVKAWIQPEARVDLRTHGGHQVLFDNRKIYGLPFLLKHYPIRSQAHGEKKVLQERRPRYNPEERAKQWHVQYDCYGSSPRFVGDPAELYRDRPVTILTLTRFPEIFARLADSVDRWEPTRRRIVVTSGGAAIERQGWLVIRGIEPFVFGRNANLGIAAAGGDDDILLVNDDVEFTEPIIDELGWAADQGAGLITPQVIGDGINHPMAYASRPLSVRSAFTSSYLPFVCVLLRRQTIAQCGALAERFTGYGSEDVEFCGRAQARGFRMAVSRARVKHGFGEHRYSSSFLRVMTSAQREQSMREMGALVKE